MPGKDHECPTCGRDGFASEFGVKQHHSQAHGEPHPSIAQKCLECSTLFRVSPSEETKGIEYCSEECREVALYELRECEHCGSEESVLKSNDAWRFCSAECKHEGHAKEMSGESSPVWKGGMVSVECERCGDEYEVKPCEVDRTRFCGDNCKDRHRAESDEFKGENHPLYSRVEVECFYCGDTNQIEAYRLEVYNRHFCDSDCVHDWQATRTGQDNPNWRGGKSVYDAVKKQLRPRWNKVREEYTKGRCRSCGSPDDLHLHHIIPLLAGGCNEPELTMTLCRGCHNLAERKTWSLPEVQPVFIDGDRDGLID